MLVNGKSLAEIASYTSWQRRGVLFLKRDRDGQLVRRRHYDLPEGVEVDKEGRRIISNPVSLGEAFRQVHAKAGLDDKKIKKAWKRYKKDNPKMGKSSRG